VRITDSKGKTAAGTLTVNVYSIEHKTIKPAPDGTPDDRTTIGVGEKVTLKIIDSSGALVAGDWYGQDVTSHGGTGEAELKATDIKGDSKVTARVNGADKDIIFSVVEPSLTAQNSGDDTAFEASDCHAYLFVKVLQALVCGKSAERGGQCFLRNPIVTACRWVFEGNTAGVRSSVLRH
jgi:hypothetical protein